MAVPVQLITVAREFASGGSLIAHEAGRRLGWRVVEQNLVHQAALRLHLDDATAAACDECVSSLIERLAASLIRGTPEVLPGALIVPPEPEAEPDVVAAAVRGVLREEATRPPLILVGHGAQCMFAGRDDALRVFVHAPMEARIARYAGRMGGSGSIDPQQAARELRRRDAARAAYLRHHYGADWRDPGLYDLVINTGRIGIAEAAAALVGLVEGRIC